jgi:peptidyl-prolyl cis-trans isomerase D
MSILIVSFAIWGIEDVFRGLGSNEVASVGDSSISMDSYQRAFNQQVQQLSRRGGKPLTPSEARLLGVDRQVLSRLTTDAALSEQAGNYGLGLSQEKIAEVVLKDPAFQDDSGRFNRDYFNQVLRDNGFSEAAFFAEQQRVYLRSQLIQALVGQVSVPKVLQEAAARYGSEARNISFITLTAAQIEDVGQPSAAELKAYFDERKGEFRAPEYRKFTYLFISPDALAARASVTDDDARAEYDAHRDRYTTPEKRTVQQIAFDTEADARAASERIKGGQATFDAIATERKITPADLDLGAVTRAELLDPAVADAAFKLPEGGVSDVVQGRLSTVLLRVTKIEPEVVTPFDSVKDEVKKTIAFDRAKNEIHDLQEKVEDERAGGATLKEIAGKIGLEAVEVAAMDAQGRDPNGQSVNLPQQDAVASAVFANEVGTDTEVIDGRDVGLVWYTVEDVTPARDRTLDEAKDAVTASWQEQQRVTRLQEKAEALLKDLRGGKSIEEIAKAVGVDVQQAWGLKRNTGGQGLSQATVNQVFATPLEGFATAPSGNGTDRIVFRVDEVTVPPFDAAAQDSVAMRRQLDQSVQEDLLAQYVDRLQADLGLTVNPTNLNRALGGGGDS